MKVVGRFLVQESFTITGVGFTIIGQLIEGDVKPGNRITLNTGSGTVTLTIHAIDHPARNSFDELRRGLRFNHIGTEQKDFLAGVKVPEQQVEICADLSLSDPADDYMQPVSSTAKVIWHKAFERHSDMLWINWAIDMIEAGFQSENLYILAGCTPPFEPSVMNDLTTAVLKDLSIDYTDKQMATKNYAYSLIKKALADPAKLADTLYQLQEFYYITGKEKIYRDFYFLYFAYEELNELGIQFYWEGATRKNIDTIIRNRFLGWLRDYETDHF